MDLVWVVIIFAVLAALPDLLRRKRRYPHKKAPKPGPLGDNPAPSGKRKPIELKRKRTVLQRTEEPTREKEPQPQVEKSPERVPRKGTVVKQLPLFPETETVQNPESPARTMPHTAAVEPWSGLSPQAQQIYSGIVWSEILQPPVSRRNRP